MFRQTQPTSTKPEPSSHPVRQNLRELLEGFDLEHFLLGTHKKTRLELSELRERTMEVIAELLLEDRFHSSFPNVEALAGYIQKVTIRRIYQAQQASQSLRQDLHTIQWQRTQTPEELLLHSLHEQSLNMLLQQVFQQLDESDGLQADILLLVQHVLAEPDRYLRTRQSGSQRGQQVLNSTELATTLGWNRQRVYERLERLRTLLLRLMKELSISRE